MLLVDDDADTDTANVMKRGLKLAMFRSDLCRIGRGIDPEIMPRLFSKFATKSDKGTGLGLFISKSIIEAHGGMMWAENNRGSGRGATSTFSIPRGSAARGNL